MVDIFAVVADGTRREILRVLRERAERGEAESSVSQIVADLGLSQPTVSKHLKVLRESGLVSVREQGQRRFYRIDPRPLAEVASWLEHLRGPAAGAQAVPEPAPAGRAVRAEATRAGDADREVTEPAAVDTVALAGGPDRAALGPHTREFAGALGRSLAGAGHRVGDAARRVWPARRAGR